MQSKPLATLITLVCSFAWGQAPSEPKELTSLRGSFLKARDAAIAPLEKKYSDALTEMKTRFTKAGNLEAALAVDSELKSMQTPTSTSTASAAPAATNGATVLEVRGSNHYRVIKGEMTLAEAEALAAQMGGQLASFKSSAEMMAVNDAMTKAFGTDFPRAWIGLRRSDDGNWSWTDGTKYDGSVEVEYGEMAKYPRHNSAILRYRKVTGYEASKANGAAIVDMRK